MELLGSAVASDIATGSPSAPAAAPAAAPPTSLGYTEEVGSLLLAKRTMAKASLGPFRQALEESSSSATTCEDEMLCRFLETNVSVKDMQPKTCNLVKAQKDLEATVKWRAAQGLDGSLHPLLKSGCACCDKDAYAHCCFSIGKDKRNWMATYMCAGRTTNKDHNAVARHLVLLLEQIFCAAANGAAAEASPPSHFVILLDLHGFSLSDMDPRVAMHVIPIILNHYPDRVAQVCFLDAPWVFKAAWQLIKTVIDPISQTKVRMLRGSEMEDYFESFLTGDQAAFCRGMKAKEWSF